MVEPDRLQMTIRHMLIAYWIPKVTNILTYLLTPWRRVLLEKLTSELCN
jgi:hypothetical protein